VASEDGLSFRAEKEYDICNIANIFSTLQRNTTMIIERLKYK